MRCALARPLAALVLALATAGAASAGSVYVPLAKDVTVNGIRYQTQVWVSNKGEEARRFSSYFIPTDTDGTDRPDGSNSAPDFTVNGRNTVQLTDFAPVGGVGMLELTGAPQLLITAKLVPIVEDGEKLGATLPVISSDNLLPANTLVQIQELERTDTRQTDFVLANLAQTAASCNVAAFRFDGSAIGVAIVP